MLVYLTALREHDSEHSFQTSIDPEQEPIVRKFNILFQHVSSAQKFTSHISDK